jgi:hypothetical protein
MAKNNKIKKRLCFGLPPGQWSVWKKMRALKGYSSHADLFRDMMRRHAIFLDLNVTKMEGVNNGD